MNYLVSFCCSNQDKWRNMGGQASGAIVAVNPRAKSSTTAAQTPNIQSSALVLVPQDNINDKPPQSPEGVKRSPKYVSPLLSENFSCSIIL